jgi:hypothetical protein
LSHLLEMVPLLGSFGIRNRFNLMRMTLRLNTKASDNKTSSHLTLLLAAKYGTRGLHCAGNPPFGHQAPLAIKFVKQMTSQKQTKNISDILPAVSCGRNSFKDKHTQLSP